MICPPELRNTASLAQTEFQKNSKILHRSFGNSEQLTAIGAFNCRHLHYVWVVAKAGGVAQAGEQLHLTLPSISGQLSVQQDALR